MNQLILNQGKHLIKSGSLWRLKQHYKSYHQEKKEVGYHNDVYFFQKWFTHSCSCKELSIAKWLYSEMFLKFDELTQIAIRTTFNYCKVVMDGKKHPKFKTWLTKITEQNQNRFSSKTLLKKDSKKLFSKK